MLVKDGKKGSYILGGVAQIVLAALCIFVLMPFVLNAFGVDVSAWSWTELSSQILFGEFGQYVIVVECKPFYQPLML